MPRLLISLIAMLLIVLQGVAAMSSNRVLCLPVCDSGTPESLCARQCGHEDALREHEQSLGHAQDHQHGIHAAADHPDMGCSCHVHIPMPGNEHQPTQPRHGEMQELRVGMLSAVVVAVLDWDSDVPRFSRIAWRPPSFSISDQSRSLKSTRLLI